MRSLVCRFAFALALLLALTPVAEAQDASPDTSAGQRPPVLDRQLLLSVYHADGPAMRAAMRMTNRAAFPLFFGAPALAWGVALLREDSGYDEAYRLTLSEGLALGAVLGLKKIVKRPRPYHMMAPVRSRSDRYNRRRESLFPEAFPSGHAAVSFAMAMSWSLSHPEWYVVGPTFAGAALLSTSRLWLGVHYPSDVLGGALLGTGLALGVHLLRDVLTPSALETNQETTAPMLRLRVQLP